MSIVFPFARTRLDFLLPFPAGASEFIENACPRARIDFPLFICHADLPFLFFPFFFSPIRYAYSLSLIFFAGEKKLNSALFVSFVVLGSPTPSATSIPSFPFHSKEMSTRQVLIEDQIPPSILVSALAFPFFLNLSPLLALFFPWT